MRDIFRGMIAVGGLATLAPAPAQAQHAGHAGQSPYVGSETRAIKALSAEEVQALRAGEGMGLALAAELNGVPGPRHVLELAQALELTPLQRAEVEAVQGAMQEEARRLGAAILAAEEHLDRMFASGHATSDEVGRATAEIGRLQGELRSVHLEAHLVVTRVLTREQITAYPRLRGYGGGHGGKASDG